ncbi:UNVERIFIED_CONTAM: hypothetical protein NCL1_15105 [Trichonephila clavipes]
MGSLSVRSSLSPLSSWLPSSQLKRSTVMDSTDMSITMVTRYPSSIIPMDTTDIMGIMADTDTAKDISTWSIMDIMDTMDIMVTTDITDTIIKYSFPDDNIRFYSVWHKKIDLLILRDLMNIRQRSGTLRPLYNGSTRIFEKFTLFSELPPIEIIIRLEAKIITDNILQWPVIMVQLVISSKLIINHRDVKTPKT